MGLLIGDHMKLRTRRRLLLLQSETQALPLGGVRSVASTQRVGGAGGGGWRG